MYVERKIEARSSNNMVSVVCVCVRACNLGYPARNAHEPYCQLWPVRLYIIFPRYLTKGTCLLKLLNIKCVLLFPLQDLSETFFILRRTERDVIRNFEWSSCQVPVILVRF
jgi:hypothetical protein